MSLKNKDKNYGHAFAFAMILMVMLFMLVGCNSAPQDCPPKSDTEIIAETISDILQPKIRWGC